MNRKSQIANRKFFRRDDVDRHHSSLITHHPQAGFGLLEVVLSAGILATVVGASVGLLNSSLHRAVLAGQRSQAMNLAQEGIELVRAMRDTTYVDQVANEWTAFFPPANDDNPYSLVYHCEPDVSCSWLLAQDAGQSVIGRTEITAGTETITLGGQAFARSIFVTVPSDYADQSGLSSQGVTEADVIRKVRVVVSWGTGPGESVESIVYLTNWRQGV